MKKLNYIKAKLKTLKACNLTIFYKLNYIEAVIAPVLESGFKDLLEFITKLKFKKKKKTSNILNKVSFFMQTHRYLIKYIRNHIDILSIHISNRMQTSTESIKPMQNWEWPVQI
jgi:hypothetical protein